MATSRYRRLLSGIALAAVLQGARGEAAPCFDGSRSSRPLAAAFQGLASHVRAPASSGLPRTLMSQAQVDYLSSWRSRVNPDGKPLRMIYGGIGPDLSTPLLAADPVVVHGVDDHPVDAGRLEHYLNHWDKVEADVVTLKNLDPDAATDEPNWARDWEAISREWLRIDLHRRWHKGYWDIAAIRNWSVERLMVYELKRLGVDRRSVRVSTDGDGSVVLRFAWGAPGRAPRERTFRFILSDLETALEAGPGRLLPEADVYYQKSAMAPQARPQSALENVPRFLAPGGSIVMGMPFGDRAHQGRHVQSVQAAMGRRGFEPIAADGRADARMAGFVRANAPPPHERGEGADIASSDFAYGWRLFGFRQGRR